MTDRFPADESSATPATDTSGTLDAPGPRDPSGPRASTASTEPTAFAPAPVSRGAQVKRGMHVAVAGLFGIFYAYYLWDAIRSLIELPAAYEAAGLTRDDAPWSLLILGLILPVVTFVGALIVARHRNVAIQALIFLAGLGALSALSLGVIALA